MVGRDTVTNRTVPDRSPLYLPERSVLNLKPAARLSGDPAKENSGLVQSRQHPGLYWLHNDSGDQPRIYPVLSEGESFTAEGALEAGAGTLLIGAENNDWEDITVDDLGHVIVADVGNNKNKRRDLALYYIREPDPGSAEANLVKKQLVYYPEQNEFPADEDQFNFDCEAVFTVDNVVHLLTKHRSDNWTRLYRLDHADADTGKLTWVDQFETNGGVTGADCAPDGLQLVVITYQDIWLFERADKSQSFFDGNIFWAPYIGKQIESVAFRDSKTLVLMDEQLGEVYLVSTSELTQVQTEGIPSVKEAPRRLPSVATLEAVQPGAWTMVVIPDTQYYVDHSRRIPASPEVFRSMTQWIVDNKKNRNIQLAVHVGDIVDNDEHEEWKMAKQQLAILDGEVPYVLATGNHDYQDNSRVRESLINEYFSISDNSLNDPANGGILLATYQPDHIENAIYQLIAPDGRQWLFVSLEWSPRDQVVQWANEFLDRAEYRKHTAVLVNHGYLYHDNTRYDWSAKGKTQNGSPLGYGTAKTGDNNDGQMLWQKLVKRQSPFQMVLCGHVSGHKEELMAIGDQAEVGYRLSVGAAGNRVHQLLFNAQKRGDAGEGWLRLLEFSADKRTVEVKTYSPWLDSRGLTCWRTDADDYFQIKLTHW